jgi:segregation and condensation protein B
VSRSGAIGSAEAAPAAADNDLDALLEALLMVAHEPAAPGDLAVAAGVTEGEIAEALARAAARTDRGWIVVEHAGRFGLATAPRFAAEVRRFLGMDREAKLSAAALETLAVIAYRQPVSRAEIEAVRGVDCTGVLSTLHGRGLIEQAGRAAAVGAPILYATTATFLHHFGLRSLADLPPLAEVNGHDPVALLDAAIGAAAAGHAAEAPATVEPREAR